MSAAVILELPQGRSLIRLEVRQIGGRAVVTFRKCHRAGGGWEPTRTAIAFPLEAFPALHRALRGLRGWRRAGKRLRGS
jgi:hypothetical protein